MSLSIFRARVERVERLGPGMIRVVFGGPGLAGFATTGVGDEYLRVFLPDEQTGEVRLPVPEGGHGWSYPDGVEPTPLRTYTVRGFDAATGEVTIDFVVHEGGVAAAWALRAAPGDEVGLTSPTGLYEPPADGAWQLLVADGPGLPAAVRLLEQAPPGVRTRAVLEVPDATHILPIDAPDAEIAWIFGGNGHGPSRIEDVVRTAGLPDTPGYVWVAAETKVTRAVRKHLRHERKLAPSAYKIIGYWTAGAEEWRDRYENLDEATKEWLTAIWDSGRDEEEIEDEVTEVLERLGL